MVHQEDLEQNDSTSLTDIPTEATQNQIPNSTKQPSQNKSSTSTSDSTPNKQSETPPLQEELGKTFALRKIQMASLAIHSSHSASQSPLFPKHDMFQLYQKPFVASSLSTPTTTTAIQDKQRFLPPTHLLPSSSSTSDRALLDRTWSMLASKSESNQQQQLRKKPGRRVTFNDNIEFFELPPTNYNNDPAPPPTYSSSANLATEATHLVDNGQNQIEYHQDIENGKQPSLPQIVNQWDEPYTSTSNEHYSPELQTTDIPKQINSYTTPSSVSSSTSSNSMTTLSLSSSSVQSDNIINNSSSNNMTTSYDQRLPLFSQQINASTSSLPAYNPIASSMISLDMSTSSSPNPTSTGTPSSQRALQRKGNTISRNAILEILSNRTPSNYHRFSSNNSNSRRSHSSKRQSSQQQLHHQVSTDFHHTLDSVQNEIKEAIQRAKGTRVGNGVKLARGSPSIESSQTNENQLQNVDRQVDDLETMDTIATIPTTTGDDDKPNGHAEGTTTSKDISKNQGHLSSSSMAMDHLYTEDDSDSNTLHGENNSNETIYADATEYHDRNDSSTTSVETPLLNSTSNQPSNHHNHPLNKVSDNSNTNDSDNGSSVENTSDVENNQTSNALVVYLPSPQQQVSDFGDILRNEFDRITSDVTQVIASDPELATATMGNNEPQVNVSSISITHGNKLDATAAKIEYQDEKQNNSSIAWRILGCQDKINIPVMKNPQSDYGQSQNLPRNGRLYIKVIAAENLDFPINQNAPNIQCSVNDGTHYFGSGHYKMQHDIHFNHEFILNDINPDSEFTLTLHAIQQDDQSAATSPTRRWTKRTSLGGGVGGNDISRYINRQDGALAQTRISLAAISYQCRTRLCTASFALVNGWYQSVKKPGARYPLLLSRSTKEKRHTVVQEKAVGKLTMELFYLPNVDIKAVDLPVDMDSCENALNIQKFHRTVWLSGYMSQLGGDVKYWRRRYFKLIGGQLLSYTDTHYSPRTMIDLSKAVVIASDNRIVMETNSTNENREQQQQCQHVKPYQDSSGVFGNDAGHNLLMALESQTNINTVGHNNNSNKIMNNQLQELSIPAGRSDGGSSTSVHMTTTNNGDCRKLLSDDDDVSSYSVKNGFQLKFDNGEMIEFFCDSADERERWLGVLKVILGRIPALPSWLSV